MAPPLLDKRLIFVTGKGGVGKSTISYALGLVAARRGKRTIVCELAQQERGSQIFSRAGVGAEETEIAPGLGAISIDSQDALEDYLRIKIGSSSLTGLLVENRIFQYLAAAAPGVRELITMGKVWELAQLDRPFRSGSPYDLVIVDAPATGHGLAFLSAPQTFREIARVGPVSRQADRIDAFLRDPRASGVLVVAAPDELAIAETLELHERLDELGLALDAVVVNTLLPERFSEPEAAELERARVSGASRAVDRALAVALAERRRALAQRRQLRRLLEAVPDPVTLPFLFDANVELEGVERLADELEASL